MKFRYFLLFLTADKAGVGEFGYINPIPSNYKASIANIDTFYVKCDH